ncbi:MAG: hypothetical protein WBA10_15470, partial [Elainellaceae cyanobacterium]
MTTSSHLPLSSALPKSDVLNQHSRPVDLELMCIQDETGRYLSVSWPEASRYGIAIDQLSGSLADALL